jgi:hypothetical protein
MKTLKKIGKVVLVITGITFSLLVSYTLFMIGLAIVDMLLGGHGID